MASRRPMQQYNAQYSARTHARLANVSLSTTRVCSRLHLRRYLHHLASSPAVSPRYDARFIDSLHVGQCHVTKRTAKLISSPPERQTDCFQVAEQVDEKSVSLAVVVHQSQLAPCPQADLAGSLGQSSRSRRATRAPQRRHAVSFARRVTRRSVLQVTAAASSWDHSCLAAFSCLVHTLRSVRALRGDLIRDSRRAGVQRLCRACERI